MPTVLENITTASENIATKIAEISANPKPNYSIDGQSVSHNEYMKMLLDSQKQLLALQTMVDPYIVVSQVI